MAKRRVEIALQDEINDQDTWNLFIEKDGLKIIDVYQEWCGPCSAVVGLFKRLKTEINDDLLHFAVAKADSIDSLHLYRGKCEPYFLFYGGSCLVAAVKGVNPPVLEKHIVDKLKQEHDVMNGEAKRVEIRDPMILAKELEEAELRRKREEEEEVEQEVTIAVLKPDVVSSGQAEEIIEHLKEKGIKILEQQERLFTTEEAEVFYENVKDQPYYNDLVQFMTSGPSRVLVCALEGKQGVIEELRGLIGPSVIEDGVNDYPETIRAKYASGKVKNAIHAADSREEAAKELAFFYPNFEPPIITVKRTHPLRELTDEKHDGIGKKGRIERTVALLRPQAYELYKDKILEEIKSAGFTIAMQKVVQLTKEQVEDYYKEHRGEPYFGELTVVMSSGPCLALLLAREDAVKKWREMLGPTKVDEAKATAPESLRAQFIMKPSEVASEKRSEDINLLHGSADADEVKKDLDFFFPVEKTIAAIKPDAYANRDEIIEKIKSAGFHVAARRDTSLSKELAEKLYADCSDKPFYEDLVNHMISGQTLFMVLTRRDAIAGWRQMMGPTDPNLAAEEAPGSLRSTYGRDILRNAVHGASNIEQAQRIQELLFENIEISDKSRTVSETIDTDKDQRTEEIESNKDKDDFEGENAETIDANVDEQEPVLQYDQRVVMEAESARVETSEQKEKENLSNPPEIQHDENMPKSPAVEETHLSATVDSDVQPENAGTDLQPDHNTIAETISEVIQNAENLEATQANVSDAKSTSSNQAKKLLPKLPLIRNKTKSTAAKPKETIKSTRKLPSIKGS
ncbi:unnamed protein product [Trichobilharzia szidati]|nr:unnamed protein product [Trichobilharzia szidati]